MLIAACITRFEKRIIFERRYPVTVNESWKSGEHKRRESRLSSELFCPSAKHSKSGNVMQPSIHFPINACNNQNWPMFNIMFNFGTRVAYVGYTSKTPLANQQRIHLLRCDESLCACRIISLLVHSCPDDLSLVALASGIARSKFATVETPGDVWSYQWVLTRVSKTLYILESWKGALFRSIFHLENPK